LEVYVEKAQEFKSRPRVLKIGAGLGGLSAPKALAKVEADVTVVDRRNYHLFQPLLYQLATAGLSPSDIASPIRSILRDQKNTRVVLARVTGVDLERRLVRADERELPYDIVIVATGARHAYFGHDEWEAVAYGIKTIDDATYLRRRILLAFETAETETDPAERRRLLNFVIVGGGPTGVEMAGAIAELARRALAADFRTIDSRLTRNILVESGPRVLSTFNGSLSEPSKQSLEKLGVELRFGRPVEKCDTDGEVIGNERVEARTIIWAAGVKASPAGKWLQAETDRAGHGKVLGDLSVPGHPFVIGDTGAVMNANGRPVPGVAAAAKQQGNYVASLIKARLKGHDARDFAYKDYGSLATIGRKSAVAQLGRFRFTGLTAWILWSLVHVYYLIGFRNRLSVALSSGWNYVTFHRGTRLITGSEP
jgi:NADH dehydrogenase